MTLCWLS